MRILDTRRAKERHEAEAADDRERHEVEQWLAGGNPAPLTAKGIWGLWDGHGGRSSTQRPGDLRRLAESLRRQLGLPQASP